MLIVESNFNILEIYLHIYMCVEHHLKAFDSILLHEALWASFDNVVPCFNGC